MTTYVICKKCGKKFKSQYQIENLEKQIIGDNFEQCPLCNGTTVVNKSNMINE